MFPLMQLTGLRCQLLPFSELSARRIVFEFFVNSEPALRDVNHGFVIW
jgi:hypothetical protein